MESLHDAVQFNLNISLYWQLWVAAPFSQMSWENSTLTLVGIFLGYPQLVQPADLRANVSPTLLSRVSENALFRPKSKTKTRP